MRLTSRARPNIAATFTREESGSILMMAVLILPVLFGFIAFAIEFNSYLKVRGEAQNALDQATIAAVVKENEDVPAREGDVKDLFAANLPPQLRDYLISTNITRLEVKNNDGGADPLTVYTEATAKFRTSGFGSFVGFDTMDVFVASEATRNEIQDVEAVIAFPFSGTMCAGARDGNIPDDVIPGDTVLDLATDHANAGLPQCRKFKMAADGVHEFITTLQNNKAIQDLRVGLIPYNYKVKFPNSSQIPAAEMGGEPSSFYTSNPASEVKWLPVMRTFDTAPNMVKVALDNWRTATANNAGTGDLNKLSQNRVWSRTDLPTCVAQLMFDPSQKRFFNNHTVKPSSQRAYILMGDGSNAGCCYSNWPKGDYSNQYGYNYNLYNVKTKNLCTQLKNDGVRIYSILLGVDRSTPGNVAMHDTFARCSHDNQSLGAPPSGNLTCKVDHGCFNIEDINNLNAVFREIAGLFIYPILSK